MTPFLQDYFICFIDLTLDTAALDTAEPDHTAVLVRTVAGGRIAVPDYIAEHHCTAEHDYIAAEPDCTAAPDCILASESGCKFRYNRNSEYHNMPCYLQALPQES